MALNSLDEEILQGPIGGSMLERFRSFIAEAAAAASQVSGATRCCGSKFVIIVNMLLLFLISCFLLLP